MARICIVGDSWGTHAGWPTHLRRTHVHLQARLEKAGHRVKNFSIPGGSNGSSIHKATKYYTANSAKMPKYVIWFHTESLRDRQQEDKTAEFTIGDLLRQKALRNYELFNELLVLTGARDLIIGGQAPVITELLLHDPYYLLEDWRSELLGTPSTMTHTICNSDLFERPGCKDSAETITRMLEDNIRIIDLCKDSVLFPDNAHPGGTAHKSLFEKIIDYIK